MTTTIGEIDGWDIPVLKQTAPARQIAVSTTETLDWSLPLWITLPAFRYRPAPEAQIQAIQILDWTGLSMRTIADLVGTTHPTLSALMSGRSTELSKKPQVLENIQTLHALVERLVPLAADARTLADCLVGPEHSFDGTSLASLAIRDSPATAYMAALRMLRPRAAPKLRESFAQRPEGTATVALGN